ncbi:MAG: ABC transporter permease [Eubacteriales bacterium]|nr:ABC transporter permease [Eubacteriales bacterium]
MHILTNLAKQIIDRKKMIMELARADFKKRFVGSYFGIVWMFIQPIVTILIYFCIFQLGFKSTPPIPDTSYVLWLVPGIIPWFFFQDALQGITNDLQEYHYLVKKVVFPVELLPVIKGISALFVHGCFLVIMLFMFLISGRAPMLTWIQILYYSFAAMVLAMGIGYFTSAINVFFKDMAQIVGIALQFGMWLAPIMYWEGMFTERFPEYASVITLFFKLNPFYYIVAGYRDSMLTGSWFWERPMNSLYFWAVALLVFYMGLKLFMKLRPHFSDVL